MGPTEEDLRQVLFTLFLFIFIIYLIFICFCWFVFRSFIILFYFWIFLFICNRASEKEVSSEKIQYLLVFFLTKLSFRVHDYIFISILLIKLVIFYSVIRFC